MAVARMTARLRCATNRGVARHARGELVEQTSPHQGAPLVAARCDPKQKLKILQSNKRRLNHLSLDNNGKGIRDGDFLLQ